jgi:hypothetical protein
MRCRLCRQPAGWFRRSCATCQQLWAVVSANRGHALPDVLDKLAATGASPEQIELFLAADPDGQASIRDHLVADLTNELMGALGQTGRQTAADVKRVRERGNWIGYDQRPRT